MPCYLTDKTLSSWTVACYRARIDSSELNIETKWPLFQNNLMKNHLVWALNYMDFSENLLKTSTKRLEKHPITKRSLNFDYERNEQELFSSKASINVLILHLLSGNSLVEDVIQLMQKVLQIQVNQSDLIACHFLKPYNSTAHPTPGLYTFGKRRCWDPKKLVGKLLEQK